MHPRPGSPSLAPKFLGIISCRNTHTLYALTVLAASLGTLASLREWLPVALAAVEEDEPGLWLGAAGTAAIASWGVSAAGLALYGRLSGRTEYGAPLRGQALGGLLGSAFWTVALATLRCAPSLQAAATHEFCKLAVAADALPSLARISDGQPTHTILGETIAGENCDERAASAVGPVLVVLLSILIFHFHLVHVLFGDPNDDEDEDEVTNNKLPLLPTTRLQSGQVTNEKNLIDL